MRISQTDPVTVVGKVKASKINKSKTILIGGEGNTDSRISFLQNFIHDNPMIGDYDQDLLQERISKLKGGLL